MPEDLDPITAKLAAELASNILPPLTKSLNISMPSAEIVSALERSSRASQDFRTQIEKAIHNDIDENRAGRSMMMQTLSGMLDEITAVRKAIAKIPASPKTELPAPREDYTEKLEHISGLIDELIVGIKNFTETYTNTSSQKISDSTINAPVFIENDTRLDKLVDTTLPGLEGLVRANAKSYSTELREFSREISTLHEENNSAMVHELTEAVRGELEAHAEELSARIEAEREKESAALSKRVKALMILSGASVFMSLLALITLLLK